MLGLEGDALVTLRSANVDEQDGRIVGSLSELLLEINDVEECWQPVTLRGHPWKKVVHHQVGVHLQPFERRLIRAVAKVPWAVGVVRRVNIVSLSQKLREGGEALINHVMAFGQRFSHVQCTIACFFSLGGIADGTY